MSEVNVQIQNPNTSVNITDPEIIIQIAENSIDVVFEEGQPISIQVQNPVIQVNMGCCTPGGGNSGGHIIQDEGTSLAARAKLNFIGAGVTATDNPGDGSTDVTIPGVGAGGASITDITYADMQTAIAGGTLIEGAFYRITDAAGTDLGFVCKAIKTNEITVNGTGGYLNADFQAVGDYANTPTAFVAQQGIWQAANEGGYSEGDVVIWNLLHYQLTTSASVDGTDPATNTSAYTLLDKATYPETYIPAWDFSEFDFPNAWLQKRVDSRGNDIAYSFITFQSGYWGYAFNPTLNFQWGNAEWYAGKVIEGLINDPNTFAKIYGNRIYADGGIAENTGGGIYLANVLNEKAYIYQNALDATATIEQNALSPGIGIYGNIMGAGTYIRYNAISLGAVSGNNISENGYISSNEGSVAVSNNTLSVGGYISGNKGSGAGVSGNTIGDNSGIFDNNLYQAANISDCVLGDISFIRNCNFGQNITLSNKTISNGYKIAYCEIGVTMDVAETIAENIENKRAIPGFSDIPGTIDITGLTTLDCTAAWAQYRGIFNLTSSNATEAIDTITNPPTIFPFTIRPAAGLVLTITGTAYSGIAAGQIALKATDYVLDGDKGEYIVLEIDPRGTGCLVEKLVVNGLI